MRMTIKTDPLSIFFTNVNKSMNLPAHSHFATIECYFETKELYGGTPPIGFPVFAETIDELHEHILQKTAQPFMNHTNEKVAYELFHWIDSYYSVTAEKYNHDPYELVRMDLNVRGVPDKINHSDGFAKYVIER